MDEFKKAWGVDQWAAYFARQELPVMSRSKQLLQEMEELEGDLLSPKELATLVIADPLLCLRLLRQAERGKSTRLGNETTTALAAILQLGINGFRRLLLSSPEVDEQNTGLLAVEARARIAGQVSLHWATGRMDMHPEELAVAALIADTGELLMWVYAPQIAQAAQAAVHSGQAQRSSQAQRQVCGFTFKELTLRCAELWAMPSLVLQLLHGADSARAQLARVGSNAARHILDTSPTALLALAFDVAEAKNLVPAVSVEWLVAELPMLSDAQKEDLIVQTRQVLADQIGSA
ncbi:MAG: HDOD domain-containing protein [Pseudomonadota bacterium]